MKAITSSVKRYWKRIALISLGVLAALWVWPLVGQAPWEHNPALCQDALLRRRALLERTRDPSLLAPLDPEVAELYRQYPSISLPSFRHQLQSATPTPGPYRMKNATPRMLIESGR